MAANSAKGALSKHHRGTHCRSPKHLTHNPVGAPFYIGRVAGGARGRDQCHRRSIQTSSRQTLPLPQTPHPHPV